MVTMITGMAVGVVVSAITQGILNSFGKQTEAQYVDFGTKCGIGVTSLAVFAKLLKAMNGLG